MPPRNRNEMNPNGKQFDANAIAHRIAESLSLSDWRKTIREDIDTYKWAHVFDQVKPTTNIEPLTSSLLAMTQGYLSPDWLHSRIVAAWTYGAAAILEALANEDITLFGGKPLEGFPAWDNEPIVGPDLPVRDYPEDECGV